jgi:prevent-host-death family protein
MVDVPTICVILCVMKTFSVMEAQHNLAVLLREVEAGHELTITRRRKPVARLSPLPSNGPVVFPDFAARARETWHGPWRGAGALELVDESRGER